MTEMINIDDEAKTLIEIIRTSGRLRDQDHAVMARALRVVLDRRADFDPDPTEALVQAVAALSLMDARR